MPPTVEIVFAIYPAMTQLDFAGPYEVLARLPGARVRLASPDGGNLQTELGLTYRDTERLSDIERCDLICVPGGLDHSRITAPDALFELRRLAESARFVTSVCSGSLILAAAGLLVGRRSACHWRRGNELARYGALYDPARVVRDGKYISGAGVTAGIDFGLVCAAELADPITAQAIQLLLEYDPQPPFSAGRPELASTEVMAACRELIARAIEQLRTRGASSVGGDGAPGASSRANADFHGRH